MTDQLDLKPEDATAAMLHEFENWIFLIVVAITAILLAMALRNIR